MPQGLVVGFNAAAQLRKGDILGTFQYVEGEPAMILTPANPRPGGGAFVICESAVPRYLGDSYVLVERARRIALAIGMDDTSATVYRIADAILDWIPVLIGMPPKPDELKRVVDEAIVGVNGKERLAQRFV